MKVDTLYKSSLCGGLTISGLVNPRLGLSLLEIFINRELAVKIYSNFLPND